MLNQPLELTVFCLDNTDSHSIAKFLRHWDTQQALVKTFGDLHQVIGYYKGKLEVSYMCPTVDFVNHVLLSGYVTYQESFLVVPSDVRQPCALRSYSNDIHDELLVVDEVLYPMREIQAYHIPLVDGYTYVPQTGKYFTCSQS